MIHLYCLIPVILYCCGYNDQNRWQGLWNKWDHLKMFEGDVDAAAQVLSGRIGNHDRYDSRGDLKGGFHSILFISCELLKGPVYRGLKVLVAQQCSQSVTCKRK